MKKQVRIEPGCITCGTCEFIAPEIFQVTDVCYVRPNINVQAHEERIRCAMKACPVQVICLEEQPIVDEDL